jgi:thiamine-monophosphate kinase
LPSGPSRAVGLRDPLETFRVGRRTIPVGDKHAGGFAEASGEPGVGLLWALPALTLTPVASEFELIGEIRKRLGRRGERVLRAVGDDAAVVRPDGVTVTSVDTFVEGVHFRLATTSLRDLGHKCLAASMSDLAAVGASAGEAYLALGLPRNVAQREVLELMEGAEELAVDIGATICGGDVSVSNELFVAVTAVGHAPDETSLVGRDGAHPGELVGVTGRLGGAGAGLVLLERKEHGLPVEIGEQLIDRQRRPRPLLEAGAALARAGVSAMIDLSDGLASDAMRIAEESEVSIEIELSSLPLDEGVDAVARMAGSSGPELAATAGEDYELMFTAPQPERVKVESAVDDAGTTVTWIGTTGPAASAPDARVRLLDDRGAAQPLAGWDHLARKAGGSPRK